MTKSPSDDLNHILSVDDFWQEIEGVLEQGATEHGRCEALRFHDHYRQVLEDVREGNAYRGMTPIEWAPDLAAYRMELLETIEERKDDPGPSMKAEATISSIDLPPISSIDLPPQPPALGEALLLLFCPKNRARHMMEGDLEEIFHEDIKTKGHSRATMLYWCGILRSIGPLLWTKIRKAGLVALLIEIGRSWGGFV